MKINLFGYEIALTKEGETPAKKLAKQGAEAKRSASWKKIREALDQIERRQLKYSEYRVQQISGLSINTVKKYRKEIEAYREAQQPRTLF